MREKWMTTNATAGAAAPAKVAVTATVRMAQRCAALRKRRPAPRLRRPAFARHCVCALPALLRTFIFILDAMRRRAYLSLFPRTRVVPLRFAAEDVLLDVFERV